MGLLKIEESSLEFWRSNLSKVLEKQKPFEKKLFFSRDKSINFTKRFSKSESTFSNQLLKLIWECGISFYAGTFERGVKCPGILTIIFVQCAGEANAIWKPTFFSRDHSINFTKHFYNSESTFSNQLLKLIWECGISLNARAFKSGLNWHLLKYFILFGTPCTRR